MSRPGLMRDAIGMTLAAMETTISVQLWRRWNYRTPPTIGHLTQRDTVSARQTPRMHGRNDMIASIRESSAFRTWLMKFVIDLAKSLGCCLKSDDPVAGCWTLLPRREACPTRQPLSVETCGAMDAHATPIPRTTTYAHHGPHRDPLA